jgi:hypothetical protein
MVKIVKNQKSELVFTPNEKPSKDGIARGFFVVESSEISMEGGFIRKNKVTALLTVESELAKELAWTEGHTLPGKIITVEAFEPFYEGQECKINPTSKAEVLVDGKKVYRQSTYTDNMSLSSRLITPVTAVVSKKETSGEILPEYSATALNK